jgi:hypothetical protein
VSGGGADDELDAGALLGGVLAGPLGAVVEVVGDAEVGLDVGAFERLGLGDDFTGLRLDVAFDVVAGDVTSAGEPGVIETGTVHDTVYLAGLEAAATGLVTTSTASPDAGSARGAILSAARVFVPAALNVSVRMAEFCPSASAQ